MLVLTAAITLGLILGLCFFALSYTRFLGAHQEQETAIEAAALAAATDLSRVWIEDDNFGFVGISDYAPNTKGTTAGDGFPLPCQSINTLLATIRLDMIIADQIGDSNMKALALTDYNNAMTTKTNLIAKLQQAVGQGSTLTDLNGLPISMWPDAQAAYQQNRVRMTGQISIMDVSSFKISLGYISEPTPTNTPVPVPNTFRNMPVTGVCVQQVSGNPVECYVSNTNFPYNSKDFVLAPIDQGMRLVDNKKFTSTGNGLPYEFPTIIKVEADQIYQPGTSNEQRVHCIACAEPGSGYDPRPAPGMLKIGFANGSLPSEISTPMDVLKQPAFQNTMNVYTPATDDYLPSQLVPYTPTQNNVSTSFAGGWYNWVRRAGPKARVDAVNAMKGWTLTVNTTADTNGLADTFFWMPTGDIYYARMTNMGSLEGSNKQTVELGKNFTSSNGTLYRIAHTDISARLSRAKGGKHAGEPLIDPSFNPNGGVNRTQLVGDAGVPGGKLMAPVAIAVFAPLLLIFGGLCYRRHGRGNPFPVAIILVVATIGVPKLSAIAVYDDSGTVHGTPAPILIPKLNVPTVFPSAKGPGQIRPSYLSPWLVTGLYFEGQPPGSGPYQ